MARSRRRDDDSDEYEVPQSRTTRVTGGFGLGFSGAIGCVCGLVFLFCVLPIGFLVSGGCVAKEAVEAVREREQANADRLANQKAADEQAAAQRKAEQERIEAERNAELARLKSPLKVGDSARVKAGDRPHVSTTRDGLGKLLTALDTKDERALIAIGQAGTSGRADPFATCKVLAVAGINAQVRMDADGREWWILYSVLEHVPKAK